MRSSRLRWRRAFRANGTQFVQKQGKLASELGLYGLVVPSKEIALRTAEFVAQRSSCVRGQIGALVLDRMNAIVGVGWNIESASMSCAEECPRARSTVPSLSSYKDGPGRCISTHAEPVAITDALLNVEEDSTTDRSPRSTMAAFGGVLVVSYTPCPDCMEMLKSIAGLQVISGTRRTVR